MKCIITGVETDSRYKDYPLSTDARFAAKKLMELDSKLTMTKAINKLMKDFRNHVNENWKDIGPVHAAKIAQDSINDV